MIPNVFLAHIVRPMKQGDRAWVVYVRKKVDKNAKMGLEPADGYSDDEKDENEEEGEYYWCIAPYTATPNNMQPPEDEYIGTNPDNVFTGGFRYIGKFKRFRGSQSSYKTHASQAQEAVYSTEVTSDRYRKQLVGLPEVNLVIGQW